MYDIDTIEQINVEQIATATDWLLLRGVRKSRPRSRGFAIDLAYAPTMHVRPAPKKSRGKLAMVAAGIVAAYASLAIAVACYLA